MFSFLDDIFAEIGLPFEIIKGGFRLINFCNKAIFIEGIKAILKVEESEIEIKLTKGIVKVSGEKLKIKKLNKDSITIVGIIKEMEMAWFFLTVVG